MTPKTSPEQLAALADLLDGPAYDLVAGIVMDIRDEHPRAEGDVDSGVLLDRLITELRRIASEQST